MASVTRTYSISGMDCGSCAASLETALSALPAVWDVEVSFAREKLALSHDPETMDHHRIEHVIRHLGFIPSPDAVAKAGTACSADNHHHHGHKHRDDCCDHSDQERDTREDAAAIENGIRFAIEGMDCASCASTIATAVKGLPGVTAASVSIGQECLTVVLSPQAGSSTSHIEDTVRLLGFGIAPLARQAAPEKHWWDSPKLRHLVVSVACTAAAFGLVGLAPALKTFAFTAAVAFAAYPIARRAVAAAQLGAFFTIQMLMTIAVIGAVIIGEQTEALLVVLLFSIGEMLEGLAAQKARSGIKALGALLPQEALLIEDGDQRTVAASRLRVGQSVLVRPGDRVPVDGRIVDGSSSIDESPLTGESIPVHKSIGADVFAGTINHDAALTIEVTCPASDNTIARIITMVEEAQDAKAPTERFIERFSKVYMPIIIATAIAVAILPPLAACGDWMTWIYRALALLLIGCPCALVISVPAAIAASLAAGARHGILIKGGATLENIAKITTIAFDKTGTLTKGAPEVTDVVVLSEDKTHFLELAFGIEKGSSHPLAEAICDYAVSNDVSGKTVTGIRLLPGRGMEANWKEHTIFVGSASHAAERAALSDNFVAQIEALQNEGKTVAVVTCDAQALGLFAIRDEARPTTTNGLNDLKSQNLDLIMMTGDHRRTAKAIAGKLGLKFEAEMLPETKAARVAQIAAKTPIMMVGDGVNDAPALARAQVGVAIGSGTDVALETADAALMKNDIGDVARLTQLSKRTMRNIYQNVAIALGLKAVFLATTVTGVSGLWMAVLADTGATVLVTLNAMRLLGALKHKDLRVRNSPRSRISRLSPVT